MEWGQPVRHQEIEKPKTWPHKGGEALKKRLGGSIKEKDFSKSTRRKKTLTRNQVRTWQKGEKNLKRKTGPLGGVQTQNDFVTKKRGP